MAIDFQKEGRGRAFIKVICLQNIIVVTASVKKDERGGQGHTFASLLHQSAT
jgi:hypothetical protein